MAPGLMAGFQALTGKRRILLVYPCGIKDDHS